MRTISLIQRTAGNGRQPSSSTADSYHRRNWRWSCKFTPVLWIIHSCFHRHIKCKYPPGNTGIIVKNKVARFMAHGVYSLRHPPPIDSFWAVMTVWRLGVKISRTVLCCVVYDSCGQWYTHTWTVLKSACWFRFRFCFCVFV